MKQMTSARGMRVWTGLALLLWGGLAAAQVCEVGVCPTFTTEQFGTTGFIQAATLDPQCSGEVTCGGTITINGQLYEVPRNTIMQFPASTHTWQEVFALAPAPYGPTQSGLALTDTPPPLASYEVTVMGNRVRDASNVDHWIVGLMWIAQESLMGGSGHINFIDHQTGEIRIGGVLGDRNSGARAYINDPQHRFTSPAFDLAFPSYVHASPDVRFSVDDESPTIVAATGYPMCVPDVDDMNPALATTARCPISNRPLDPTGVPALSFMMPAPNGFGFTPDPMRPLPLLVGDFVDYAGTLLEDALGPYISLFEITGNLSVLTQPGIKPAYINIEVVLMGTGGVTAAGINEATIRTKAEGMTTDASSTVDIYAVDVDPCTGDEGFLVSDCRGAGDPEACCTGPGTGVCRPPRAWIQGVAVDPGPPLGAIPGRWRFRPTGGVFLPPTREIRVRTSTGVVYDAPGAPATFAGTIRAGQYHAPIEEFIPPEQRPGNPVPPANFEDFPFLAQGSGPWDGGPIVGQLSPWPGTVVPATVTCGPNGQVLAPTANAGADSSSIVGLSTTLSAAGSIDNNVPPLGLTFAWLQTGGPATVTLSSPDAVSTSFTPTVIGTYAFSVNVCVQGFPGACSTDAVQVFVSQATAPQVVVDPVAPIPSGTVFTITAHVTDSFNPVAFSWTQIAGTPVLTCAPSTVSGTGNAPFNATLVCQAPTIPTGNPPRQYTYRFTATNSAAQTTTVDTVVTVNPQSDIITITAVQYRTGKARLTINASDNVIGGGLLLSAFWTDSSHVEHALGPMQDLGGGLWSIVTQGVPMPTSVRVTSNFGGSATSPVTQVRN